MEAVLAALEDTDGWTTTSEIKRVTGLDTNHIRYRFEKLEEHGKAQVRDSSEGSAPIPPKEIQLTPSGIETLREVTEGGIEEEKPGRTEYVEVSREEFETIQQRLAKLENQYQSAVCPSSGGHPIQLEDIKERVEDLEDGTDEERIEFLHTEVEKLQARSLAFEAIMSEFSGVDIDSEVEKHLSRIREY